MKYNDAINNIMVLNHIAYRSKWGQCNNVMDGIFIKQVEDASAKRGHCRVRIKPFFVISNKDDYGVKIYYPTQEDLDATDWITIMQ